MKTDLKSLYRDCLNYLAIEFYWDITPLRDLLPVEVYSDLVIIHCKYYHSWETYDSIYYRLNKFPGVAKI